MKTNWRCGVIGGRRRHRCDEYPPYTYPPVPPVSYGLPVSTVMPSAAGMVVSESTEVGEPLLFYPGASSETIVIPAG